MEGVDGAGAVREPRVGVICGASGRGRPQRNSG